MTQTRSRKDDHIRICMERDTRAARNHFDDVHFTHCALPEVNLSDVDMSCRVFGRKLGAPLVVSAITGGSALGGKVNGNIARAAADLGIGMGVGSQRAAMEDPRTEKTYSVLADCDVPLRIANIGLPQFIPQPGSGDVYGHAEAERALDMIDGHLLAVHMNFLQEVVQPEGDTNARGALRAISRIASKVPVMAKETGAGIGVVEARALKKAGVKGLDVGGQGGTSFSAVEVYRARAKKDGLRSRLGETFWNWGIPTPASILECSATGLPIIGTGGVRNGLDAAKAIALGASAAGLSYGVLPHGVRSYRAARGFLSGCLEEMRAAMFLTGTRKVKHLREATVRLGGDIALWLS